MILDFTTKGQVKISMIEYVKEVVAAWDKATKKMDDGFTTVQSKRGKKGRNVRHQMIYSRLTKMQQNLTLKWARPSTT